MLVKTEYYTKEDTGEKRKIEYYGNDEDHIYGTIDSSAEEPPQMLPEMYENEQMDLESYTDSAYTTCLTELSVS